MAGRRTAGEHRRVALQSLEKTLWERRKSTRPAGEVLGCHRSMYMLQLFGATSRLYSHLAIATLQRVHALYMLAIISAESLIDAPLLLHSHDYATSKASVHVSTQGLCLFEHRARMSSARARPSWRRCNGCPLACGPCQRPQPGALCRRLALAPGRPAAGTGGHRGGDQPRGSPPATCAARRRRPTTTTCCSAMAAASMCAPACLT